MSDKKYIKVKKWWWILLVIALIIAIISAIDNSDYKNKYEDYKYCIDNCIWDNYDCVSYLDTIMDKNYNEYVLYEDYQSCVDDLDICIGDCEIYGS